MTIEMSKVLPKSHLVLHLLHFRFEVSLPVVRLFPALPCALCPDLHQ